MTQTINQHYKKFLIALLLIFLVSNAGKSGMHHRNKSNAILLQDVKESSEILVEKSQKLPSK